MKKIKNYLSGYTLYEKLYWLFFSATAVAFALLFPEDEINGVSGSIYTALMLADTVLNVTCELQISKQDKTNFLVSVFIELTEIAMCVIMAARFAELASLIFFWLPIDIVSFIAWKKHPDKKEEKLTEVRALSGRQLILLIAGVILWTALIGQLMCYITDNLTVTDIFGGNRDLEIIGCYIDALVVALDIANGVFIFLRFREQWIAWYLGVLAEAVFWIISGQYNMLVLTAGYLVNTTYGLVKWSKYSKEHGTMLGQSSKKIA